MHVTAAVPLRRTSAGSAYMLTITGAELGASDASIMIVISSEP